MFKELWSHLNQVSVSVIVRRHRRAGGIISETCWVIGFHLGSGIAKPENPSAKTNRISPPPNPVLLSKHTPCQPRELDSIVGIGQISFAIVLSARADPESRLQASGTSQNESYY